MNRKRHSRLLALLAGLTVALALGSCNRKAVYSHYEHTPMDGQGWERRDTLFFDVPPVRAEGCYAGAIGLRCTSSYPFKRLALIVTQQIVPRGWLRRDTVFFQIVGDNGLYLGEGINYFQYALPLPDCYLAKGDSMHVSVNHYMLREELPGVSEVGFTLTSCSDQRQYAGR